MSIGDSVVAAGAVVLAAATWLPVPARRPCFGAALAVTVLGLAATTWPGPVRWQQVPVALAVVVAAGLGVVRLRTGATGHPGRRRLPRVLEAVTTAGCVLLAALGGVASWAFPEVELPPPGGRFPVGTTVVEWTDPLRPETATARPDDRRTVIAQLWYPAAPTAGTPAGARYLGRTALEARTTADGLADLLGVPGFLLDDAVRARTGATADAPAAPGRYPVVVFSPGLGGVRMQSTAWAQDVASHGYVVVALDHPYDSAVVVRSDGSVVRSRIASTGDDDADDAIADAQVAVRAADMRSALTRLEGLDRGAGLLGGRVDTHRVVAAGHSLGGAAAVRAADGDPRFDAVVVIDGFPRHLPAAPFPRPVLVLVAGRGTGDAQNDREYAERVDELLRRSSRPSVALTVPGAAHLTFTDAPLYLPPVPSLVGSLGRTGGHRATTGATLEFLGATSGGRDASLDRWGDVVNYR